MELTRQFKKRFLISMRSADFIMVVDPSGMANVHVKFLIPYGGTYRWYVRSVTPLEALNRISDYWEKGKLTNPANQPKWEKDTSASTSY